MAWATYRRCFLWSSLVGAVAGLFMVAALVLQEPSVLDSDYGWQWLSLMLLIFSSFFSFAGLLLFGLLPIALGKLLSVFERKTRDVDWANIAKPLITFTLCLPLFVVSIVGDTRFGYPSLSSITLSDILAAPLLLVIPSPAFVVHFSARMPRFQNVVFILFLAVVTVEFTTGITPTSQLNHEGTDILWFFVHLLISAIAMLQYCAIKIVHIVVGKDAPDE